MLYSRKTSSVLRKLSPWALLIPGSILMVGVFAFSVIRFFDNSLYSFAQGQIIYTRSFSNYVRFFTDPYFLKVLWTTVKLAALSTFITLILSYPVAYAVCRMKNQSWKQAILMVVFLPLVISVIVRSYGWFVMLSSKGVINWFLLKLGFIDAPLSMMYTEGAVLVGMIHVFLPFMVFSILSVLVGLDPALKEAAFDLGANKFWTFIKVTFPLSFRGVLAGIQIVFTLAISAYVSPVLLGGGRVLVLSKEIYDDTLGLNWPMAATVGVIMLFFAYISMAGANKTGDTT